MPRKKVDYRKVGEAYAKNGGNLSKAMVAGGFSELSSRGGFRNFSREGRELFDEAATEQIQKNNRIAIKLSKTTKSDDLKDVVRGALIRNIGEGKDNAIQSIKAAGNLTELQMFQPDSVTGVIVINAVPIPSFDSIPGHTVTPLPQHPEWESKEKKPHCDHYIWQTCYCRAAGNTALPAVTTGALNYDKNFDYKPPEVD